MSDKAKKLNRLYVSYTFIAGFNDNPSKADIEDALKCFKVFINEAIKPSMITEIDRDSTIPFSVQKRYSDFLEFKLNEYIDEYINSHEYNYWRNETRWYSKCIELVKSDLTKLLNTKVKDSVSPECLKWIHKYYGEDNEYKYLFSFEKYLKGLE